MTNGNSTNGHILVIVQRQTRIYFSINYNFEVIGWFLSNSCA